MESVCVYTVVTSGMGLSSLISERRPSVKGRIHAARHLCMSATCGFSCTQSRFGVMRIPGAVLDPGRARRRLLPSLRDAVLLFLVMAFNGLTSVSPGIHDLDAHSHCNPETTTLDLNLLLLLILFLNLLSFHRFSRVYFFTRGSSVANKLSAALPS